MRQWYKRTRRIVIKTILVAGGAGYIGSHICIELLEAGFDIVVVDNLSNSDKKSLERVEIITSKSFYFYQIDLRDEPALTKVFETHQIDAVIHLAGLKAVGESCALPLMYYQNNITASLVLLEVMQQFSVMNIVFSSSATVYGDPKSVPINEGFPLTATNPYGRTKLMIEEMLTDIADASPLHVVLLRYFNPAGAHESGLIGEDPNGIPNNLLPYVSQVAIGQREKVAVFGGDYSTPDGTGVRDYIHVVDLAKAHIAALERLLNNGNKKDFEVFNVGTGTGSSVLEVIKAFEKVSNTRLNYKIVARREGDITSAYADTTLAKVELGWETEKTLEQALLAAWKWQLKQ